MSGACLKTCAEAFRSHAFKNPFGRQSSDRLARRRSTSTGCGISDLYFMRFMAACRTAELSYLEPFRLRESRQRGLGNAHPDTVEGPWQQLRRA
jgi:hypothetical protein